MLQPGRSPSRFGAWEVEGLLGRGGMGELYLARHAERGTPAALKVLRAALQDPEAVLRFQREARALFAVRHPVVVTPLDAGRAPDGRPWLVMERVEGESLQARVARAGPLPPLEAARLVERLARALHQVHAQGVAHRDLKPDNVLVTPQGDVRLVDFGLARFLLSEGSLTTTSELLGTPAYMAPEQADGRARHAGAPADVYGLGGTLFFALTGRAPFDGASAIAVLEKVLRDAPPAPSSLAPAVPRALDAVCLRCLAKDPAARFESALALAAALADVLRPPRRRATRRRRAWLAVGGAAVLALALVALALAAADRGRLTSADPEPAPPAATAPVEATAPAAPPPPARPAAAAPGDPLAGLRAARRRLLEEGGDDAWLEVLRLVRATQRPEDGWRLPAARRLARRAPDRVDVALELAWALHDGGQTDAAVAAVDEARARAPDSAEALMVAGILSAASARDADAFNLLQRARALDPGLMEARVWLVLLAWERGAVDRAEALAAELVAAEPLRATALEARATLRTLAGRHPEALADFVQAARLAPHLQRTQTNMARSALEADALDQARRASEALVGLRPWEPDPWALLAEALLRAGDLRGAVAANDKALELAPARDDLVARRQALIDELLGPEPTPEAARRLVGELQRAGARPSAFRLALAVLQDPDAVPADALRAARLAAAAEEVAVAEQPLRQATERWPRSSAAWAAHALIAPELAAAAASAARAVAAGPGDAETLHALGLVTIRITGWAEAVPFFRAAAEADRDHVETRALLVLHEHGHEGEGAAAAFERLAAAAPHLFILQHHLALARRARGDWPGVLEAEDRALALEHGEADCWYFRAEARLQLADPDVDAAVADLGRSLALVRGETHREVGVWLLRAQARLLQADLDGALEDARRAAAALDPRSVASHMALDALRAQALAVAALDPTQRAGWEGLRGR